MSWLDFSRIPVDSPLKQNVTGYIWMGSVGEGYSPLMAIMPMAYRVWSSPTELYDGDDIRFKSSTDRGTQIL